MADISRATSPALQRIRSAVATIPDPELPVLTIADLGILRSVSWVDDCPKTADDRSGRGVESVEVGTGEAPGGTLVEVVLTPTYSGCPALHAIEQDVVRVVAALGYPHVRVRTSLTPAWTSDWMSETGRQALAAAGIAPPGPCSDHPTGPHHPTGSHCSTRSHGSTRRHGPVPLAISTRLDVRCPQCGSSATRELSRFGSTACKALWRCDDCQEPFDHFKAI
ncbi:MAG: 1,2-phenylacetyl-CoA epoxidase subunit PaaD [Angustibacter sp.]